jgi:membrane-associated phospholipid phosphatase
MTYSIGHRRAGAFVFLVFVLVISVSRSLAQNPAPSPSPSPAASPRPSLEKHFLINVLKDQYDIWTSPLRLQKDDWKWGVPLAAASIALLNTDEATSHALHYNKTRLDVSKAISIGGTAYATGGSAIAIYAIGRATHDARARETGILSFEAFLNTGIVTQVVKTVARRPRPLDDNGEGEFFVHGSSFISGHSSSIWTLAAIVNDEYGKRHPWVRYGMFGLATAVSLSRYTGQNHFLGDILVGSAVGYGIGHFVYLKHHDQNLDQPSSTLKPVTKFEKYFPRINTAFDHKRRTYGVGLAWNF